MSVPLAASAAATALRVLRALLVAAAPSQEHRAAVNARMDAAVAAVLGACAAAGYGERRDAA